MTPIMQPASNLVLQPPPIGHRLVAGGPNNNEINNTNQGPSQS